MRNSPNVKPPADADDKPAIDPKEEIVAMGPLLDKIKPSTRNHRQKTYAIDIHSERHSHTATDITRIAQFSGRPSLKLDEPRSGRNRVRP